MHHPQDHRRRHLAGTGDVPSQVGDGDAGGEEEQVPGKIERKDQGTGEQDQRAGGDHQQATTDQPARPEHHRSQREKLSRSAKSANRKLRRRGLPRFSGMGLGFRGHHNLQEANNLAAFLAEARQNNRLVNRPRSRSENLQKEGNLPRRHHRGQLQFPACHPLKMMSFRHLPNNFIKPCLSILSSYLFLNPVTAARAEHCVLAQASHPPELRGEEQRGAQEVINHDLLPTQIIAADPIGQDLADNEPRPFLKSASLLLRNCPATQNHVSEM